MLSLRLLSSTIFISFFSYHFSYSQSVEGNLIDENNEAVPFASVALFSADSVLIKAEQSDFNGYFAFLEIESGNYFLSIRSVGYQPEKITINNYIKGQKWEVGSFKLTTAVTRLDDVVIRGQKPLLEILPGKTTFNVDSDPSNLGNDGITLLSRAPGITIDPDGNIVFQGKTGVRVFINGRPSRLSGDDLNNMLLGLQADNIESIELITNPSSKYEAEGNSGIINIKLKKSTSAGINGTLYGNASRGTFDKYNTGVSLNFRKNKVNMYGSLNYADNDTQDEYNHSAFQNEYRIDLAAPGRESLQSLGYTFGSDYYISDQHYLGFFYSGNSLDRGVDSRSRSFVSDAQTTQLQEILISENIQSFNSDNNQFNLNYEFSPNDKNNLSVDLNYGFYQNSGQTSQPNTYLAANELDVLRVIDFEDERDTEIDIRAAKIDYEINLKGITISTGSKASIIGTANDYKFYNLNNDVREIDLNRSNFFEYTEEVYAVYGMISSNLGARFKYSLGLRYEHTFSLGELTSTIPVNNNSVKRNYGNYFPNAGLTYNSKNKELMLALSYGKRVARPNYQNLNPFEYKLSELQFFKGNPFLLPSFTDQFQFSYSIKNQLTGNIGFSREKDYVAQVLQISDDKSNFLRPENMQEINNYFVTLSIPVNITDWWEIRNTANYSYNEYYGEFNNTVVNIDNHFFSNNLNNNFSITDRFRANVSFSYYGSHIWRGSILIDQTYRLNFGLSHTFFNDNLHIRITGNDILNTGSDYPYLGNYGGLYVDGAWSGDFRRYGFGLTWKFGNQNLKGRKERKTAIDDELNRID